MFVVSSKTCSPLFVLLGEAKPFVLKMTISMVSHATLKALLMGLLLLVTVRADQAGHKRRNLDSKRGKKMKRGGVYARESYREEIGGGGKYAEDYMKKGKKCSKGSSKSTKAPSRSDGKGKGTKAPSESSSTGSSTKSPSAYSRKSTKAPFVCDDEDSPDETPSPSDAPVGSKAPSGSSTKAPSGDYL
jgi:hypothetical protein